MNCKAFRARFEVHPHARANLGVDSTEAGQHLADCAECKDFVETQREVVAGLTLLRESEPGLDSSFDAGVIARYRQQNLSRTSPQSFCLPPRSFTIFCVSGAAAVLAVIAVLLVYGIHKPLSTVIRPQPMPAAASAKPVPEARSATVSRKVALSRANVLRKAMTGKSSKTLQPPSNPSAATALGEDDPTPAAFRGLMYCDPLSCGGPMEMIRVRLPFFPDAFPLGLTSTNGVVYADVVVGSDGVARGIRILK